MKNNSNVNTANSPDAAVRTSLVSVIIPCFNDGQYIQEALLSLAAQTYNNIEVIIIDDGSDDPETVDIIGKIHFPRLKILHTDHLRPAGARNAGILQASGVYILPLDADDTIEPTYIEKAVRILDAQPEVGIVYCHADLFGIETGKWELADYSLKTQLVDNCIFVTSMFRREDWEAVGGFSTDFIYGLEDYDFWLSIIELGREVVQLPGILFHYRIKSGSRSSAFKNSLDKIQQTYIMLYERHKELYLKNIDMYCLELRRVLNHYIWMLQTKANSDNGFKPILQEWNTLGMRRPRLAAFVIGASHRFVRIKNLLRRLFHLSR